MAAKIKDGLFVGDEDTSMSEVFINDNKISNLINLSGMKTPTLRHNNFVMWNLYVVDLIVFDL